MKFNYSQPIKLLGAAATVVALSACDSGSTSNNDSAEPIENVEAPEATPTPTPEPEPESEPEPERDPTAKEVLQEVDGLAVVEFENLDYPTGWEFVSDSSASGTGYIQWTPYQAFQTPETGMITIELEINNPGTYRLMWRNSIRHGTSPSDHNDTWLKVISPNFYGKNSSGHIVCPRQQEHFNRCDGEAPHGSSAKGALKIYRFGTPADAWVWHTYTSDNNIHPIYADFDEAGVYEIQISARSTYHALDRLVIFRALNSSNNVSETYATSLDRVESVKLPMLNAMWVPPAAPEPDPETETGPLPSAFDIALSPTDRSLLVEPTELKITASATDTAKTTTKATLFVNGIEVANIEGAGPYEWIGENVSALANLPGGRPDIKVAITDSDGEVGFKNIQVKVNGKMAGTYVHAYNFGGADYTAKDGQLFTGIGWAGLTTDEDIQGTDDDALYQNQQTNGGWFALHAEQMIGDITINPGSTYQIDYYFAEIEHNKVGQRAVDIYSQGAQIASALDVYSIVGANAAYKFSIVNTATEDLYKSGIQTNAIASFDINLALAAFSIRYLDVDAWGDADQDGVANFDDKCATTLAGASVDDKGCELP